MLACYWTLSLPSFSYQPFRAIFFCYWTSSKTSSLMGMFTKPHLPHQSFVSQRYQNLYTSPSFPNYIQSFFVYPSVSCAPSCLPTSDTSSLFFVSSFLSFLLRFLCSTSFSMSFSFFFPSSRHISYLRVSFPFSHDCVPSICVPH